VTRVIEEFSQAFIGEILVREILQLLASRLDE
jgi:hypothetical protein